MPLGTAVILSTTQPAFTQPLSNQPRSA